MDAVYTFEVADGRRIELCRADLSQIPPDEGVDLLVVSAFRDDYTPTPNSLIGALDRAGVSVRELASDKEADLRSFSSCWMSRQVDHEVAGFHRLLCYEPVRPTAAPAAVADVFRAMVPYVDTDRGLRTVAMPILGTGDMRHSIEEMLGPLLEAAVGWMSLSLPLERLIIGIADEAALEQAQEVMRVVAAEVSCREQEVPVEANDLFISYARADGEGAAKLFVSAVRENEVEIKVFLDRFSIQPGQAWQEEIYQSIASCRRVALFITPGFVASDYCQDEMQQAVLRLRKPGTDRLLFPIYLNSVDNYPPQLAERHYVDCREGNEALLREAAEDLVRSLS